MLPMSTHISSYTFTGKKKSIYSTICMLLRKTRVLHQVYASGDRTFSDIKD